MLGPFLMYLRTHSISNIDTGAVSYTGYTRTDGSWIVERSDAATGTSTYAHFTNNPRILGYGSAWLTRLTLQYTTAEALGAIQ